MSTIVQTALHAAALSAMVGVTRSTVTHQHARSSGGFKDIINALNAEGAALFVVPSANVVCDTLGLRSCHIIQVIWVVLCRPEV